MGDGWRVGEVRFLGLDRRRAFIAGAAILLVGSAAALGLLLWAPWGSADGNTLAYAIAVAIGATAAGTGFFYGPRGPFNWKRIERKVSRRPRSR